METPKAIARVIVPLGLPAPVTFGGRLDTEHATGPLSRWMGERDRSRATSGTGSESVPGLPTLPTSSIRRLQKGSNDGAGEIHRRRARPVSFGPISPARCEELLQSQSVGRIAWQAADGPQILPVTYAWHEGTIIFRTSPYGVLSELVRPTDVAMEIDELDQHSRRGWSVVVQGRAAGSCRTRSAGTHVDGWRRCSLGCRRAERLHPDHSAPDDRPGGGRAVWLSLICGRSRALSSTSVMMITGRNRLRDGTLVPIILGPAPTPIGLIRTSAQSKIRVGGNRGV